MKNFIKAFFSILLFFLLYSQIIFSQEPPIGDGEFMIINESSNSIQVSIYPSGAIFNGNNEYNIKAYNRIGPDPQYDFIYPRGPNYITLDPFNTGNYFNRANFDKTDNILGCNFSLGYGGYKIEIFDGNPMYFFYIDFRDANFCNNTNPNYYNKIKIRYYGHQNIKYNFCDNYGNDLTEISLTTFPEIIQVWVQYGITYKRNKGNFTDAEVDEENFLHNWPIDASYHNALGHEDPDHIGMNLKLVNHNASMHVEESNNIVFYNCIFEISDNMTFNVDGGPSWSSLYIKGPEAKFISGVNSNINFNSGNGI